MLDKMIMQHYRVNMKMKKIDQLKVNFCHYLMNFNRFKNRSPL